MIDELQSKSELMKKPIQLKKRIAELESKSPSLHDTASSDTPQFDESIYRQIFQRMSQSFAVIELLLDDLARPVDCIILDCNPAFNRQLGLTREQVLGNYASNFLHLMESGEKRRTTYILESIQDPFFTLDKDWNFTYVNEKAWEYYSPHKEIVGQNIWFTFPAMIDTIFWEKYRQVMKTKKPVSFEAKTSDIGYWSRIEVYPCGDGISVLFRDISERKQAEEALRQSEDKFAKSFHGLPIMMFIATIDEGRFIDVNQAFCSTVGYEREDIIGKTSLELKFFNRERRRDYVKCIEKHGKVQNIEGGLLTRTGASLKCLYWGQSIKVNDVDCHITGIIDITEKTRLETAIARLDRLNLIGEMAASIGHEIRNPLTAIRGFLQMIRGKDEYHDDRVYFDLMIEELDRANAIISEYLGMAKDKRIDLQPRSLDSIIRSLHPILQSDANCSDMNILLDLGNPPPAPLDTSEVRQLILNMSRNALEAMSPGGTLTIGTKSEAGQTVLFIKDEGHGLPPDVQQKLGIPFTTTKENGTGLGLAVCFSIAARHQASIDFKTDTEGTTFFIRFPYCKA